MRPWMLGMLALVGAVVCWAAPATQGAGVLPPKQVTVEWGDEQLGVKGTAVLSERVWPLVLATGFRGVDPASREEAGPPRFYRQEPVVVRVTTTNTTDGTVVYRLDRAFWTVELEDETGNAVPLNALGRRRAGVGRDRPRRRSVRGLKVEPGGTMTYLYDLGALHDLGLPGTYTLTLSRAFHDSETGQERTLRSPPIQFEVVSLHPMWMAPYWLSLHGSAGEREEVAPLVREFGLDLARRLARAAAEDPDEYAREAAREELDKLQDGVDALVKELEVAAEEAGKEAGDGETGEREARPHRPAQLEVRGAEYREVRQKLLDLGEGALAEAEYSGNKAAAVHIASDLDSGPTIAWGEPQHGLRLGVGTYRRTFAFGGPIWVGAILENVSEEQIILRDAGYLSAWPIDVYDSEGAMLPEVQPVRDGGHIHGEGLGPGDQLEHVLCVTNTRQIAEPGSYTLIVRRRRLTPQEGWLTVSSAPVSITIDARRKTTARLEAEALYYWEGGDRLRAMAALRSAMASMANTIRHAAAHDEEDWVRVGARRRLEGLRDDIDALIEELDRPAEEPEAEEDSEQAAEG